MILKEKKLFSYYTFSLLLLGILFSNCDDSNPINPPLEEEEIELPTPTPTPTDPVTDKRTIAFYNVENLFDTEDDPDNGGDNEFLPTAAKKWNQERYLHKLNNIGSVIEGMNFPVVMGVSEVENKKVLEDLIAIDALSDITYAVVHEESPDHRGIDVGFIYQPASFTLLDWETYQVDIPDPNIPDFTTRDILRVKGELSGKVVHIFVNHWPSRSGGTANTEFRRVFVAERLRGIIDDLLVVEPSASIIVMGDLNDEPTNTSVETTLNAQELAADFTATSLYNATSTLDNQGEGSYNYQGNWQMIDQIIATGNLLTPNADLQLTNFQIFKEDMLLFMHSEYGLSPDRTYGGDNYYGGFSDHLPVFIEIVE